MSNNDQVSKDSMGGYALTVGFQVFCLMSWANRSWAESLSGVGTENSFAFYPLSSGALPGLFLFVLVCFVLVLFRLFADRKKWVLESEKRMQVEKELIDVSDRLKKKHFCKYRIESEERYTDLLESIMEGYLETDLDGRIVRYNHSVCDIAGQTGDDIFGMHFKDFFKSINADRICEAYEQVARSGEPTLITACEFVGHDHVKKSIEISASIIKNVKKAPTGFRGIIRDVTVLEQAEKEKKRLEDQLQRVQQIESLGTLASGIAHDFNNLLMGIQGNVSILLFKMDKAHPSYEKLTNIEACIRSGAALTKQLLGFTSGRSYDLKTLCMAGIVKETAETFQRTKKEILIHEQYHKDTWPVEGDRGQIEQVIMNLFINSWESMDIGKELFVDVSNVRVDSQNGRPSEVASGNYVKVLVSNTPEIFKDNQDEHLTFSLPKDFKTGISSGLGLASSFGVIRGYDGAVDYRRLKDGGTAYIVCLPALGNVSVKKDNHETVQVKGSGTVLFVDDEEMIVEIGKPMLEELGYDVLVARGGDEAIKVYEVNKGAIDLVILDLVMPKIDGGEVFETLKKLNPGVKTLLSSGYSVDERAAAILDRGCNGFIQKPFNLKRLSEQIQSVLLE